MRVLKFVRVDFLKCRRFLFILLMFPALAVFMVAMSATTPALFAVGYCLFAGIMFAAMPFNMESMDERGFLQMLPARPGEPTMGHFLFGLLTVALAFLLGIVSLLISGLFVPWGKIFTAESANTAGMYPALLGAALLFVGLEDVLLTFLRYERAVLLQFIRLLPAFLFFFIFSAGLDEKQLSVAFPLLPGLGVLAVCLAVYAGLAALCRAAAIRRGE